MLQWATIVVCALTMFGGGFAAGYLWDAEQRRG